MHSDFVANIYLGAFAHFPRSSHPKCGRVLDFSGIPIAVCFNFDGIPVDKRSRLFLFVHFVLNIFRFAATNLYCFEVEPVIVIRKPRGGCDTLEFLWI